MNQLNGSSSFTALWNLAPDSTRETTSCILYIEQYSDEPYAQGFWFEIRQAYSWSQSTSSCFGYRSLKSSSSDSIYPRRKLESSCIWWLPDKVLLGNYFTFTVLKSWGSSTLICRYLTISTRGCYRCTQGLVLISLALICYTLFEQIWQGGSRW